MEAIRQMLRNQFSKMGYRFTSSEGEDKVVAIWIIASYVSELEGIDHHTAFMALLDLEDNGIIKDISVNNDEVKYFNTRINEWVVIPIVWDDVQRGLGDEG